MYFQYSVNSFSIIRNVGMGHYINILVGYVCIKRNQYYDKLISDKPTVFL